MNTCTRHLLSLLLLAVCIANVGFAQPLATLLPGADGLPAGCTAKVLDEGAPPFLETNPQVSSEPAFLEAFFGMLFADKAQPEGLEEALVAVYDAGEENEVGVFGFRYESAVATQHAADSLFAHIVDEGLEVLAGGTSIALVWRDRGLGPCYAALHAHVQAVLRPDDAE